jgi:aspartate racemase
MRDLYLQVAKGDLDYKRAIDKIGKAQPDSIALVHDGTSWTYEKLFSRVDKLSAHLQSIGILPNDIIGVYTDRNPEMIIGVLAILKAGATFLPLDPKYPEERIRFMVGDTETKLILSQEKFQETVKAFDTDIFCIDSEWDNIETTEDDYQLPEIGTDDLAYIIYTSGSTGTPKGVMITFGNLLSYTLMAVDEYELTAADTTLQFGTMNFDVFIEEVFPTYLVGGTLILRDEDSALGGDSFWSFIKRRQISFITLPTAFWHTLCTQLEDRHVEMASSLRLLVFGGESMSEHMLEIWQKYFGTQVRLINSYGPSETTVGVTGMDIQNLDPKKGKIPIGKPFKNVECYILDEKLKPCEPGIKGELYIAGPQVGKGYLNRPELTSERFIKNPFSAGHFSTLYKTGDLCTYLSDGNIAFEGRNDFQVKISGRRIELGEIETAINRLESVKEAVVTVRQDELVDKKIVAYFVPSGVDYEPKSLREQLKNVLPEFMIPKAFVSLDKIPLTANGKKDKRSLPAPERKHFAGEVDIKLPQSDMESQLLQIWEKVLKISPISVEDNFFDIGGHSLIAVILFDEIRDEIGADLPIAALFEAPSIREMASYIDRLPEEQSKESTVIVALQNKGKGRPFFCIHGHFGNVLFLKELANKVGERRPFYGIQSVGLMGSEEPLLIIDQMADRYLREMKKIQPTGPYSFGGYCYGTLVARVMAQKLDKTGESYYPIIMIDPQPDVYNEILDDNVVAAFKKVVMQQKIDVHRGNIHGSSNLAEKGIYLFYKTRNKLFNKFNEAFLSLLVNSQGRASVAIPNYLKEVEICNLVAHNHQIENIESNFNSDVEIILSAPLLSKYSKNPMKDWSGFTKGKVNVHLINDDGVIMSDLMFKAPYVNQLAEIFTFIWDQEKEYKAIPFQDK